MEKKKLLLVAVSVGVVLLIIIGIPLLLVSPRQATTPSWQTTPQVTATIDPFARTEPPAPAVDFGQVRPEPVPEPAMEAPVVVAPPAPIPQEDSPRVVTTITIPAPRTVAVPDAPTTPARQAQPRQAPTPPAPAAQPARQQPPAAARPAVQAGRNNFWIQAGAFSSKARAETVKESLEAKGIASIIENRNINGRTYYRVRIGPYLSENEANYWLGLVSSIDGFSGSWVSQVPAPAN
ncbi:MAG: SPOR domain-containing protein [Treponema sp.]|nr:SPOR domain-containing protein [Treponema sp.]